MIRVFRSDAMLRVSMIRVFRRFALPRVSMIRVFRRFALPRVSMARVFRRFALPRVSMARVFVTDVTHPDSFFDKKRAKKLICQSAQQCKSMPET